MTDPTHMTQSNVTMPSNNMDNVCLCMLILIFTILVNYDD